MVAGGRDPFRRHPQSARRLTCPLIPKNVPPNTASDLPKPWRRRAESNRCRGLCRPLPCTVFSLVRGLQRHRRGNPGRVSGAPIGSWRYGTDPSGHVYPYLKVSSSTATSGLRSTGLAVPKCRAALPRERSRTKTRSSISPSKSMVRTRANEHHRHGGGLGRGRLVYVVLNLGTRWESSHSAISAGSNLMNRPTLKKAPASRPPTGGYGDGSRRGARRAGPWSKAEAVLPDRSSASSWVGVPTCGGRGGETWPCQRLRAG